MLFMAWGVASVFSQVSNDSIYVEKAVGGYNFVKSGISLTLNQIYDLLENDPETKHDVRLAKTDEAFIQFFGYVGGFSVGYALSDMLFGRGNNKIDLIVVGSGLGSIAVSFLFSKAASNHLLNATNIYNTHLGKTPNNDVSLNFGFTPNGVGLTLSF